MAFTYLKVNSAKCLCLLPVVLVLGIWSCLNHWGYLDSVEIDVESVNLRSAAVRQFDELGTAFHCDVQRHLEVVLLLADERVVLRREVETLVGVHAKTDQRTVYEPALNPAVIIIIIIIYYESKHYSDASQKVAGHFTHLNEKKRPERRKHCARAGCSDTARPLKRPPATDRTDYNTAAPLS